MTTLSDHRPSAYRYDKGCRCDECRVAKRAKRRRARDRARAENRPSYQRELATSRSLKSDYRGVCERCGASTNGCRGPEKASKVCAACAPTVYGPRWAAERRGVGPVVEKALALLADGEMTRSEIRDGLGVTGNHVSVTLHRLLRYGMVERVGRGRYRAVVAAAVPA